MWAVVGKWCQSAQGQTEPCDASATTTTVTHCVDHREPHHAILTPPYPMFPDPCQLFLIQRHHYSGALTADTYWHGDQHLHASSLLPAPCHEISAHYWARPQLHHYTTFKVRQALPKGRATTDLPLSSFRGSLPSSPLLLLETPCSHRQ